ncbi:MAG: FTR1 family protein [bacterium]|nr:FTR1 family protein [bacterium]
MITIIFITFREFFEAWLIIGLFLGLSEKLKLGRRREIISAILIGMVIALFIPIVVFTYGGELLSFWSEANVDALQGIIMIISSLALGILALSLHKMLKHNHQSVIQHAQEVDAERKFDTALFAAVSLSIIREGFELSLFAISVVLVTTIIEIFIGLAIGFMMATLFGLLAMFIYEHLPIKKIFYFTEISIMFIGAALFKNGTAKFMETVFQVDISNYISIPLKFLPNTEDNIFGHLINSLIGIDSEFSVLKLLLLTFYILVIYNLVFVKHNGVRQDTS